MGANVRSAPWRERLAAPTHGSVARRILAVLVVIGAVLAVTPDRLSGEPTTTSVSPTLRTPALTSLKPNPHSLYPRRPGAKYDDIELPPNGSVTLLATLTIARSTIEPHRALPHGMRAASVKEETQRGLVDGYAPIATDTAGSILHVVVHETNVLAPMPLSCIATAASDGTALVPYERHPPAPAPKHAGSSKTKWAPFDVDLYFPLGQHRGRLYLTCKQLFLLAFTAGVGDRVVWAIDV
ncbi:MAG: hypothetical protein QOI44_187 [Actinomycetota bacterium]|nr:hypothetical protein [Actinomycetota bacterium]